MAASRWETMVVRMRIDWRLGMIALLALHGCDESGNQISGTVTMKPVLSLGVKESDTLFITARQDGVTGGPPLAVVRIVGATFPARFDIGQSDVVVAGQWFKGKVRLSAFLKRSGFIGIDTPGDLAGVPSSNPVAVGTQGVTIELSPPKGARI